MRSPSIFSTTSKIVSQNACSDSQYVMRLEMPQIAQVAKPGQFLHIRCDQLLLMRRPLSIMRCDQKQGYVDILYKAVGEGTALLSQKKAGDTLAVLGPIGNGFDVEDVQRSLLIGGGLGMPPMIFLAEYLKKQNIEYSPILMLGSEIAFPFKVEPSKLLTKELPANVMASMPLMEDLKIPCRLGSQTLDQAGLYKGFVTELAAHYLANLLPEITQTVRIFACGPSVMLAAVAKLADRFNLDCQLCLEEHMACAVGGCAGCVVSVDVGGKKIMKRVCVDGPVFCAKQVYSQKFVEVG